MENNFKNVIFINIDNDDYTCLESQALEYFINKIPKNEQNVIISQQPMLIDSSLIKDLNKLIENIDKLSFCGIVFYLIQWKLLINYNRSVTIYIH